MNSPIARTALIGLALLLGACAEARPASDSPDTDLAVVDEAGTSIPGEYSLTGKGKEDSCHSSGSGCALNVPEGDYNLRFNKISLGFMASAGGGNSGHDRGRGCLRARVHVVPGKPIICKKKAEYSCAAGVEETMDCGPASAPRYGYKPGQSTPPTPPVAAPVAPAAPTK